MNKFFSLLLLFIIIKLGLFGNVKAQTEKQPNRSFSIPQNDKAQVGFLWVFHFVSQNNLMKQKFSDISSEESQRQILELVDKLKKFSPTKIAVERPYYSHETLNARYKAYLEGDYKLSSEETDQIAFRLGKALGHKELYVVYHEGSYEIDPVIKYAEKAGQKHLYDSVLSTGRKMLSKLDRIIEEEGIVEGLKYMNSDEARHLNHLTYHHLLQIGERNNRIGADLVADWYEVNLKIFSNIRELAKNEKDKILIIYGQGHSKILEDLIKESPDLSLVDMSDLLE